MCFVVFRFRGQSVSRAVSHEGGDETSASLFFRENGLDAMFARARFRARLANSAGAPWGRVGRSARFVSRVVGGADASGRSRLVAHLHDGRAVVRNGGHALVVVHELVQASRALRDRTGVVSGNTKSKGRGPETTCGSANREATRGRTRVVRMESTTAMHALMLEISWPLPWLVSVPSRRSTIWGCCEGRGGGVSLGRHRSRRRKQKRSGSSRPGARSNAGRARVFPRRNARRGGRSHRTYDHLPVGHLHEARHGARL